MKETAARTGAAAAVPAAAGTVDSDTTTVGTAGPDPGTDTGTGRTKPRPGVRPGRAEAKAARAAGMEEARAAPEEAAPEAAMVDTRAVATAAMMLQANVAGATAGEVAVVVGTAATPAEVATDSSSHSILTSNYSQSSRKVCISFLLFRKTLRCIRKGKKLSHFVYNIRIKKT
jgi:hypothetical protein